MLKEIGLEDLRMESIKLEAMETDLLSSSNSLHFDLVKGNKFNLTARITVLNMDTKRQFECSFKCLDHREGTESNL